MRYVLYLTAVEVWIAAIALSCIMIGVARIAYLWGKK